MLDLTKPVTTLEGRPARIVCSDVKNKMGLYTILALVTMESGDECSITYNKSGKRYAHNTYEDKYDLINPKKKLYLLVWIPKNDTLPRSGVYLKEDDFKTNKSACVAMGWSILKEEILEVDI